MSQHIYLVQIGPVQPFIASARKVQDLAVGSTMLSRIARAGVEVAQKNDVTMLFPMPINSDGDLPKGVPHRFAFITDADPDALMPEIEKAFRDRWKAYADAVKNLVVRVHGGGNWEKVFDVQVEQWLTVTWAGVPYDVSKHGESYARVNRAMVARKQFRAFKQVHETGDVNGIKCTQTASQSALNLDWDVMNEAFDGDNILFRTNERLGSLALIKRLMPRLEQRDYAVVDIDISEDMDVLNKLKDYTDVSTIAGSTEDEFEGHEAERYFAILHMDGDKMGKALSQLKTLEEHQTFSHKLNEFADTSVRNITDNRDKKRVVLVYAGGDDVLAFAPVNQVLSYAEELRTAFEDKMGLTASAGISINYFKAPLDIALDTARQAEKTAKESFGRNAVTIRETTHSGNIRDAGGKWVDEDTNTQAVVAFTGFMDEIRRQMEQQALSTKLGFDLRELAYEMVSNIPELEATLKQARAEEVRRILNRRLSDSLNRDIATALREDFATAFVQLGESPACGWEALANRVIMARFLTQKEDA
ncbi:MAG: type III-B CRISPR-associated protein Cas10/Cmr2 [Chloroflexota bacterium]